MRWEEERGKERSWEDLSPDESFKFIVTAERIQAEKCLGQICILDTLLCGECQPRGRKNNQRVAEILWVREPEQREDWGGRWSWRKKPNLMVD